LRNRSKCGGLYEALTLLAEKQQRERVSERDGLIGEHLQQMSSLQVRHHLVI
jgi:hypothetical protein